VLQREEEKKARWGRIPGTALLNKFLERKTKGIIRVLYLETLSSLKRQTLRSDSQGGKPAKKGAEEEK